MAKSIEDNFYDWELSVFGYVYGTGETHILPALKQFLETCDERGTYRSDELEQKLSPTVAWLLINLLCETDIIEYASSPRSGWLTDRGMALKAFVSSKTGDELAALVSGKGTDYFPCFPDQCNCCAGNDNGPSRCANPFW